MSSCIPVCRQVDLPSSGSEVPIGICERLRRASTLRMLVAVSATLVGLLSLSLATAECSAAIIHSGANTWDYVAYGDSFPSVMWGGGFDQNGKSVNLFSGVLIDPHWVLTAAHIYRGEFETSAVAFGPGPNRTNDLNMGLEQYSSSIFLHPSFGGIVDNRPVGYDLALIHFDDPFSQTPATLFRGELPLGDYSVAGYGRSGFPGDPSTNDGWRRGGIHVVESKFPDNEDYFFSEFVDPSHPNYRELGSLVQPGDSGGGWFFDAGQGFELVGVTSKIAFPDGTDPNSYGNLSIANSLDLAWIDSYLYPTSGGRSPTSVPEPSTVGIVVIGGVILGWRRRRREASPNLAG